jgi:DNA-binding PadR family transcriptional regulator
MVEKTTSGVRLQLLRNLREFYPIKVDEIVLISAVQKVLKEVSVDNIVQEIQALKEQGYVEVSSVKTPFGKAENFRYKITGQGIEHLQSLEEKGVKTEVIPPKEIESRLVETYDRIKSDMEEMRLSLETSQKTLDKQMEDMRKQIGDHDQVIKTYFIRVIETFGVFVGLFAVVVVVMGQGLGTAMGGAKTLNDQLVVLVSVTTSLTIVILVLLLGIRTLILKPDKK